MAKKSLSFEDKLNKFQSIITSLESNDLALDEQISLYEEGMQLASELKEYLNQTELRIIDINNKFEEK